MARFKTPLLVIACLVAGAIGMMAINIAAHLLLDHASVHALIQIENERRPSASGS